MKSIPYPLASIALVAVTMLLVGSITGAIAAIAAAFIGPVTIPAWGVRVAMDMCLLALFLWAVARWDARRKASPKSATTNDKD